MGGGREAPQLAKNWSSGRRTKVSERAPQLGGEAGSGGRPRLGCSRPPSCARDGAERRGSPPPTPPRCRLRSTPMAPTKTRTHRQRKGRGTIRADTAPAPAPLARSPAGGGRRDHQPRAGNGKGAGLPAAPSRPAPSAGEDQSPQSRARRMLPPRGPSEHPQASTPGGHPEPAPPDTLR